MTTRNRDNNFFKIVPPITAICTLYYTLKGMKKKPTNFIPEFVGFLVKTTKKRFALNLGQVEGRAVYWGTAGSCHMQSSRRERITPPAGGAPDKKTPKWVSFYLVPLTRLELVHCCQPGILSPLCLPFHHSGPFGIPCLQNYKVPHGKSQE